jgi:hypothetical protein
MSSVNIPGCGAFAAFAEGHSILSNSFTISGTGSVGVQFGVNLAGVLNVMTDACGLRASTDTIFTLEVDGGNPVLFDLHMLTVGPLSSASQSVSERLTNTIALDAGLSHFLTLEVDSESEGHTQVPEPPPSALMVFGFAALLWVKHRRQSLAAVRAPVRRGARRR